MLASGLSGAYYAKNHTGIISWDLVMCTCCQHYNRLDLGKKKPFFGTATEILFLPLHESYTCAISSSNCLVIDGQVCFLTRVFATL